MNWVQRMLSNHHIPYITEGHPHTTEGWVNIHCPFCRGPKNFHLGISTTHTGCHCWRCGGHALTDTLAATLHLSASQAINIIRRYKGALPTTPRLHVPTTQISRDPLELPYPNAPLSAQYSEYLARRGFDPEQLVHDWGILQTGPISILDGASYNHRILIPIRWNGRTVSFQARDITGHGEPKYLACPKRREEIHHKTILYGKQEEWRTGAAIIVVEGVTDVWRFGGPAAATFGIEFKLEQVLQLSRYHEQFVIVFDNEHQAQKQARKLATKLRALGKATHIATVETDPGDMNQDDANHLVRQLTQRFTPGASPTWTPQKTSLTASERADAG